MVLRSQEHTDRLIRLADLWHQCWSHVRKQRRDPYMTDLLLWAMRYFHEGKLGAVMPLPTGPEFDTQTYTRWCARSVEDLELPEPSRQLLRLHGIKFAGEILRFKWVDWTHSGDWMRIRSYLIVLGLSPDTNPFEFNWKPKYWDDPAVTHALAQPWKALGEDMNGLLGTDPLWNKRYRENNPNPADMHGMLRRLTGARAELDTFRRLQAAIEQIPALEGLHAAMLPPPPRM